jgi:S-formylglutathione hydrolase FrmB
MRKVVVLGLVLALLAVAGRLAETPADPLGARVARVTVHSQLLDRDLHLIVVAPRGGGRARPVLVLLHGRGSHPSDFLSADLFRLLRDLGSRAPDVALLDGGDHSYYHDRSDGRWARALLEEELPVALARLHADARRVAISGFSMGGFGALDLALKHPGRFCAVGSQDGALWASAGATPSGAFDDAQDFARNDVLAAGRARARPFGRARVWISIGRDDPFYAADRELAHVLRAQHQPSRYVETPGGHAWSTVWKSAPEAFRFFASALAAC